MVQELVDLRQSIVEGRYKEESKNTFCLKNKIEGNKTYSILDC